MEFYEIVGITRPQLHSGEFNGNMCRRLLKQLDLLQSLLEHGEEYDAIPFVFCLKKFNEVCISCFGSLTLYGNFEERIRDFENSYMRLKISVTTAAHVVFNHVVQFCKYHKLPLGYFSEQASESVHRDFLCLWESSGKVDQKHSKHDRNLLDTVIRYNGRHLKE